MITDDFKKSYSRWYGTKSVLYLIAPYCFNREVSVEAISKRTGERYHKKSMVVANIDYLKELFNGDDSWIMAFLYSLQSYDMRSLFNGEKITDDRKRSFFETATPVSYSFCFDIDGQGRKDETKVRRAHKEAVRLVNYLLKKGFKDVTCVFSGGKGFHVETNSISYADYDEWLANAKKYEKYGIDMAIYSDRREWKCPYSLHPKTGRVLLPLSENQFRCFADDITKTLSELTPDHILDGGDVIGEKVVLFNRKVKPYGGSALQPRQIGFEQSPNLLTCTPCHTSKQSVVATELNIKEELMK